LVNTDFYYVEIYNNRTQPHDNHEQPQTYYDNLNSLLKYLKF